MAEEKGTCLRLQRRLDGSRDVSRLTARKRDSMANKRKNMLTAPKETRWQFHRKGVIGTRRELKLKKKKTYSP